MDENRAEKKKKANKMAIFFLIFAVLIIFFGLQNAIILTMLLVVLIKIVKYYWIKRKAAVAEGEEKKHWIRINYGGIRMVIYIVIILIVLNFLWPYLPEINLNGQSKTPLGTLLYLEGQDGNGEIVNNDNHGIQIGVGNASKGTTFVLRTKKNETGWPAFGTGIYASKPGATMEVSFIDTQYPNQSIHFKRINIPTTPGTVYTNKYKFNNYRAWTYERKVRTEIDNKMTPDRYESIDHDIEIRVYVPPKSYVEMNNITIRRNE